MTRVVVAAAIVRDGALLAARRSAPPELAGRWELPGGKVEPGETDTDALARECMEELGVGVLVGAQVGADQPLGPGLILRVRHARIVQGEPCALQDHDELRWLEPGTWHSVDWLPADLPAVSALAWAAQSGVP